MNSEPHDIDIDISTLLSEEFQGALIYLQSSYQHNEYKLILPTPTSATVERFITLNPSSVVTIKFDFEASYPLTTSARISTALSDNSTIRTVLLPLLQDLIVSLSSVSVKSLEVGECCFFELLNLIDEFSRSSLSLIELSSSVPRATPAVSLQSLPIYSLRLIYSHHIISQKKIPLIHSTAKSLELTGFMKIGYPGIILVEGEKSSVEEFVDVLESLKWKYLNTCTFKKEVPCESTYASSFIESTRYFPVAARYGLTQIEDKSGMKELAKVMAQVGLMSVFKTIIGDYSGVDF